jgi:uncharacterized Zn-binding protein involved in type VI secretion
MPGLPAARLGDQTAHGSPLAPGTGSPNVLIGSAPAWRVIVDQHACPAASVSGADGVGCVMVGSPTVLINNLQACRIYDKVIEKPGAALGPVNPIVSGCFTVLIGSSAQNNAMSGAKAEGFPLVQKCPMATPPSEAAGIGSGAGASGGAQAATMSSARADATPFARPCPKGGR